MGLAEGRTPQSTPLPRTHSSSHVASWGSWLSLSSTTRTQGLLGCLTIKVLHLDEKLCISYSGLDLFGGILTHSANLTLS